MSASVTKIFLSRQIHEIWEYVFCVVSDCANTHSDLANSSCSVTCTTRYSRASLGKDPRGAHTSNCTAHAGAHTSNCNIFVVGANSQSKSHLWVFTKDPRGAHTSSCTAHGGAHTSNCNIFVVGLNSQSKSHLWIFTTSSRVLKGKKMKWKQLAIFGFRNIFSYSWVINGLTGPSCTPARRWR